MLTATIHSSRESVNAWSFLCAPASVCRTTVGDYPAVIPEIEGSAWITGEHTFLVHESDPLKNGFRM